jgi:glutamine synthetase
MHGILQGLPAAPPVESNAYTLPEDIAPRLPRTLEAAISRFEASEVARSWFGNEFVDDYTTMRRWEVERYHLSVSEWERERYFDTL